MNKDTKRMAPMGAFLFFLLMGGFHGSGCSVSPTDGPETVNQNDGPDLNNGGDANDNLDAGDDENDDDGDQNGGDGNQDDGGNENGEEDGDDGELIGTFATFRVAAPAQTPRRFMEGDDASVVHVEGRVDGVESEGAQVVFIEEDGDQLLAEVDEEGRFEVELEEDENYFVDLLRDNQFEAALISDARAAPDDEVSSELHLELAGGALNVLEGPIETTGEPVRVDDEEVPVGLSAGVGLIGLTDQGELVEGATDAMDADRDGVPALFDVDKDGDGVMDLVDDDVPARAPEPEPEGLEGETVSGAFVFNNLKLDIDELIPPPTSLFTHNDRAVVTLGWVENPADTPAGYSVISVEAVDVPGWRRYGFLTSIGDWTVAPGVNGYMGYPASGSFWTGALYQDGSQPTLWQVWVQAPKADAALASAYPLYVEAGKSVPLNWDLSGSGTPTSNKIDFYRLKITYSDGSATRTRYATASSLFSFRTPGLPTTVTTMTGTTAIDPNDVGGAGHRANPILYPDASAAGDIVVEAAPPKYDVGSASGVIMGTMHWRFDLFYYDASGRQIGGLLTPEVPATFTGTGPIVLTLPESLLLPSPARTDVDGDGRDDFTGGYDSADVAAYKVDVTAVAVTGGDNTGLFLYFVTESGAASFSGF